MVDALAAVVPFFLVALISTWLVRESCRQGDRPDDPHTSVRFVSASDGERMVEVRVDNTLPSPVVMSASAHPALLTLGVGRSTLRRVIDDVSGASVGVVEAGRQGCYRLPLPGSGRTRRLLVDVLLWQPAGRLRRHRHVLALGL